MKKTAKKTSEKVTEKKAAKPKKEPKASQEMEEPKSVDPEANTSAKAPGNRRQAGKEKPDPEEEIDFDEEALEADDFFKPDEEFDLEADPDFEEFDLPKRGRSPMGKKKDGPSKDDFDEDFRDMGFFSDDSYLDEDDEDDF